MAADDVAHNAVDRVEEADEDRGSDPQDPLALVP